MRGGAFDATEVDPAALKSGDAPRHLQHGPDLRLSVFPAPHRWATRGPSESFAWTWVMERCGQPELWPGGGSTQVASDRLPAWTFARYRDDTRVVTRDEELSARETRARLVEVWGLMIDYVDEPAVDATHLLQWWGSHAFFAYTTGFHELPMEERPPGPRWRVMLPFSEPVDLATAVRIALWARHPRKDAGIIAASCEKVWRAEPMPAVGPGGYRWVAATGALLDPLVAIRELETWRDLDVRVRAEQALEGTTLAVSSARLMARRGPTQRELRWPVPALDAAVGALWPGRMVALLGVAGSGKSSLALQVATAAASSRWPVLVVLTRMGGDEALARILGQRLGRSGASLLAGAGDGIPDALAALAEQAPGLHLWAPPAAERTLDGLTAKVRAVSDAHGGGPPLVVVDGMEGWGVDDVEAGRQALVAGLRDLSHAGSQGLGWPGAAVLVVGGCDAVPPTPAGLKLAAGPTLRLGVVEHEVSVVVALATSADGAACAWVAKNRDGETGVVDLHFEPTIGRFH